ncbi:MAG: HAD hydrolase-like protein [Acidobacteria bacterium]|nr:HAD hydrolase-like protein [Acidobacteriota bacterium]
MKDRIIVFDMDGVLVDVHESYRATIGKTVEHFSGRGVSPETIQDYKNAGGWNNDWALSDRILRDYGVIVPYDTIVEQFNRFFLGENGQPGLIFQEQWIAAPGLLERLAATWDFAIFTGRLRMEAVITVDRFAGGLVFDPWVCADDVAHPKPHPEGLEMIRALNPTRRMLYLGDSVDDARSAKAAAVPFIGISSRRNPRHAELTGLLDSEGTIAVIENLNELESVLPA